MSPDRHLEHAAAMRTAGMRFSDAAAWRSLVSGEKRSGDGKAGAHAAWLTLLCANIDLALAPVVSRDRVVLRALLALGAPDSGSYASVAAYGDAASAAGTQVLTKLAERAVASRRAFAQPGDESGSPCHVVQPVLLEGKLHGVIVIELAAETKPHLETAVRLAQWGIGWLGWKLDGQAHTRAANGQEPAPTDGAVLLEAMQHAASGPSIASGGQAVATYLAETLGAARIAIGVRRGHKIRLVALSHGGFGQVLTGFLEALRDAMDEAADHGHSVQIPLSSPSIATMLTAAHERLTRAHDCDWALSVPCLVPAGESREVELVWTATGRGKCPVDLQSRLEDAAGLVSPLLAARIESARPMLARAASTFGGGVRHILRAAPALLLWPAFAIAVAAALIFIEIDYQVTGEAAIEGIMRRSIVAPFDGYIASADVRPGDRVEAGARLGSLDDRELRLQKLDFESRIEELSRQIDEALGQRDHAKVNILTARKEQAQAQLSLVVHNLSRTVLTAPFASFVVTGDKTQAVGAPLRKGDVLYEISPLDAFRVAVDVPQSEFAQVDRGMESRLVLSPLPFQSYSFKIERLSPLANARDGKTVFRVEGSLAGADGAVRPGMQGIARINTGPRRLGWILFHGAVNWLRLKLWTYVP